MNARRCLPGCGSSPAFRDRRCFAIASHLEEQAVEAGATVITADEVGDRFYLVRSGQSAGHRSRRTGTSERSSPARASARWRCSTASHAARRCGLWSRRVSGRSTAVTSSAGCATVTRSRPASALRRKSAPSWRRCRSSGASTPLELDRIAARLVTRRVPAGQTVFSEGEPETATTSCGRERPRFDQPACVSGGWLGGTVSGSSASCSGARGRDGHRRDRPGAGCAGPRGLPRLVRALPAKKQANFRRERRIMSGRRAGLGGRGESDGLDCWDCERTALGRAASAAAGPAANTRRGSHSSSTSFAATNINHFAHLS